MKRKIMVSVLVVLLVTLGSTLISRIGEIDKCENYEIVGFKTTNEGFLKTCKIEFEGKFISPVMLEEIRDARLLKKEIESLEG